MILVTPSEAFLASYVDPLERGWSPDNLRDEAAGEHLARIAANARAFLAAQTDLEGLGDPIVLPDGSTVRRLPGFVKWMWDGEFCGTIGFRWQPGTEALPPTCLGHVGYSVVPWKRGRGYATRAVRETLPFAAQQGLRYVEITTTRDNAPSQRVIFANGGKFVEEFVAPASLGGRVHRRYRIMLGQP